MIFTILTAIIYNFLIVPLLCITTMLLAYKMYQKTTHLSFIATDEMRDKTVIVTGANSGIGYATASDLAKRGARVILACRTHNSALTTVNNLFIENPNASCEWKVLDFKSFTSVQKFAQDILETEEEIHVLINNAGTGVLNQNSLTEDGLPVEAQVNHFGPFLLTMLLLPVLRSTAPSRIVYLTSCMHRFGTIENLDKKTKSYWQHRRIYSNTKLANILFTRKLSEHLKGTGVTVNCVHPGPVNTRMFKDQPAIIRRLIQFLFLTPEQGAQTVIYAAVAKELESVTGKYFTNCTQTTPAKRALDLDAAEKLWDMSQKVVFRNIKLGSHHRVK